MQELQAMRVTALKQILRERGIDFSFCIEKKDFVDLVLRSGSRDSGSGNGNDGGGGGGGASGERVGGRGAFASVDIAQVFSRRSDADTEPCEEQLSYMHTDLNYLSRRMLNLVHNAFNAQLIRSKLNIKQRTSGMGMEECMVNGVVMMRAVEATGVGLLYNNTDSDPFEEFQGCEFRDLWLVDNLCDYDAYPPSELTASCSDLPFLWAEYYNFRETPMVLDSLMAPVFIQQGSIKIFWKRRLITFDLIEFDETLQEITEGCQWADPAVVAAFVKVVVLNSKTRRVEVPFDRVMKIDCDGEPGSGILHYCLCCLRFVTFVTFVSVVPFECFECFESD